MWLELYKKLSSQNLMGHQHLRKTKCAANVTSLTKTVCREPPMFQVAVKRSHERQNVATNSELQVGNNNCATLRIMSRYKEAKDFHGINRALKQRSFAITAPLPPILPISTSVKKLSEKNADGMHSMVDLPLKQFDRTK